MPRKGVRVTWTLMIWALGLAPAVAPLFWPRSFQHQAYVALLPQLDIEIVLAQVLTGLILATGMIGILAGIHFGWRTRRRGAGLWTASLAMAAGPQVSSLFGLVPGFSVGHLALPVVFTAAFLLPPVPLDWFIVRVKRLLLVYVFGSLATGLLVPGWAIEMPYSQSVVNGLPFRLHGLAIHAVPLGSLVFLFLVLEKSLPWMGQRRRTSFFLLFAALATLLLSQAKVSWALLVLAYGILHVAKEWRRPTAGWLALAVPAAAVLLVLGLFLFQADWLGDLEPNRQEQILTLTGRTAIWLATLGIVDESPWFGYGPGLWDPDMALGYRSLIGWAPAQAHNQYVQALGEAGFLGLAGLLIYCVVLLRSAWRVDRLSMGLSFALATCWVLRGLTESWYRKATADGNLFAHFVIFSILVLASRSPRGTP